ncbi:Rieske (2Fe-2S) region [Salinisphaera orenii MK-B5]|uniref:Rieske (2Fe-2S) region n=1 Tax=Salinisphaera orenii MK-B5 TaxID=856730 RepID=A0A423PF41_9GAMM|nr:ring-hydroxylating oxygenase subunit alpha [Salinisphaera orenii]ROO24194.1 Rieske (2Fe-2S) region [Salinisphaera orenii MK-B5]
MSRRPELGYLDEGVNLDDADLYRRAIEEASNCTLLPPAAYRSLVFTHLEDERVWTRDWVCIGTEHDVVADGDMLPYTVGYHGIHVRRDPDGALVGAFNMAQHGGCRMVPLQCQNGTKTGCSFTSCGYSRDRGPITSAELEQGSGASHQYLGLRPERLLPVQVDTQSALIFVNLDLDASPMAKGRKAHNLVPAIDDTRTAERWFEFDCNWKLLAQHLLAMDEARAPAIGDYAWLHGVSGELNVAWCFPNLLVLSNGSSRCVIVLQPTAIGRTLCRVQVFSAPDDGSDWFDRVEARGQSGVWSMAALSRSWRNEDDGSGSSATQPLQRDPAGIWGQRRLVERITKTISSRDELQLFGRAKEYMI